MSCSCREGKRLRKIETEEIGALLKFLKRNPKLFVFVVDLVNSFRPTDSERIRAERVFLTVREVQELGLLNFSRSEEFFRLLKNFFVSGTDKQRGNFLETIVSVLGPFTFEGKSKRRNQCRVFNGSEKISDKEIDVAFSSKDYLEVHECKSNMVRQWRDPLSKRSKRGSKLHFLNSLPDTCKDERKVVPCCSGLDGDLATLYVKKVFKFYRFNRIVVIGREDLLRIFG